MCYQPRLGLQVENKIIARLYFCSTKWFLQLDWSTVLGLRQEGKWNKGWVACMVTWVRDENGGLCYQTAYANLHLENKITQVRHCQHWMDNNFVTSVVLNDKDQETVSCKDCFSNVRYVEACQHQFGKKWHLLNHFWWITYILSLNPVEQLIQHYPCNQKPMWALPQLPHPVTADEPPR